MTDLTQPLFGLPLADLWFAFVFCLLGAFLFLDGFDFGVGALFAVADEDTREYLLAAVGPFWDGNEVWLVVFGGALFAAFPRVYAGLFSRYYLLMFAILFALALRGLAPEFREQVHDTRWERAWGWSFVVGSVAAPFFLGVFAGNWLAGSPSIVSLPGVLVGLTFVALTVVEATGFLALKLPPSVRATVTPSRLPAVTAYLVLAVVVLAWVVLAAPTLATRLFTPLALLAVALTVLGGVAFELLSRTGARHAAFAAAAVLPFALVGLVAALLYPTIDPAAGLSISDAIVQTLSLNLMTVMAALITPVVVLYFVILYRVFAGTIDPEETY